MEKIRFFDIEDDNERASLLAELENAKNSTLWKAISSVLDYNIEFLRELLENDMTLPKEEVDSLRYQITDLKSLKNIPDQFKDFINTKPVETKTNLDPYATTDDLHK